MSILDIAIIIILGLYVLISVFLRWSGREIIVVGIGFLIATAIASIFGKTDVANRLAVYVYYCVLAAVTVFFFEYINPVPKIWSDKFLSFLNSFLVTVSSKIPATEHTIMNKTQRSRNEAKMLANKMIVIDWNNFSKKNESPLIRAKTVQDDLRIKIKKEQPANNINENEWASIKIKVLDTSVVLSWFAEGQITSNALIVRQELLDGKFRAVIPDLVLFEIAQTLSTNFHEETNDIANCIESIKAMSLEIKVSQIDLSKIAASLAIQYDISISQALKVGLASEIQADFITGDRELYEKIGNITFVKLIGN